MFAHDPYTKWCGATSVATVYSVACAAPGPIPTHSALFSAAYISAMIS